MTNENNKITETEIGARDAEGYGQNRETQLSANVSGASEKNSHDRPPDMVRKIRKTTYKVWAHFSESGKETLDDKVKRMLRDDVQRMARSAWQSEKVL